MHLMNRYGVYHEGQLVSGHIPAFRSRAHKRGNHNDVKQKISESVSVRASSYAVTSISHQMCHQQG
eukprot:scaffold88786_cov37-Prasinocladus_malaysianus.AAC.1